MTARIHAKRGFTLVEYMIAMVILGIFMIGGVGLMRWVVRATDLSGRLTVANAVAQSKLDSLIAAGALTSGNDTSAGCNRSWTIATTGAVRYISVTASYTGFDAASHSVSLREIYAP